ncbi:MAG: 6-phosphogluconolactonase, partial [Chloroflexi bacterium]|nr:6-phosphogluconolactonase [Chloroflexota bacterium]
MQRIITGDYEELSRTGAQVVAAVLRQKPDAALVVATGETPLGMYRELAAMRQRGEIDTSLLRIFQLDEYLGITRDDPRSLYGWLKRCFLEPMDVPESRVVTLPGDTADPLGACRDYDRAVGA